MPVQQLDTDANGIEWTDIIDPEREELDAMAQRYHINKHILHDCLDPDHLPKHEKLQDYTFIIVRFFNGNIKAHLDTLHELTSKIAIFFNGKFLITIHRLEQPLIEEVCKEEADKNEPYTTHVFVTKIIWHALHSFEQPAMMLSEQIDAYESTVLLKHTKPALLQGLYYLKRKAATCKKVLLLSDDLINFLKTTTANESAVQDVRDLYTVLMMLYDQILEDVNNLLNTYLSLAAQKTNEVMKVLTIFSVFFMPLTFIVGVYGMNFKYMPELHMRYSYPVVLLAMLIISVAIFIYFKKKKWL